MASETTTARKYEVGKHPEMKPPVLTSGPIFWLKENLFGSVTSTVLTLLAVYLLWLIIPPLMHWAVFEATTNAASRSECQQAGDGACWAFIKDRYLLLVYGFYPIEERWRPNLTFIMLLVAIAAVLWDRMPARRHFLKFTVVFPLVAAFLLLGGDWNIPFTDFNVSTGLKQVATDQFGGIMLTIVIGVTGISFSLPIGIVLALGRQGNLPIVRVACVMFIEFIRGVPLITLLFVASTMLTYFLPPGTEFNLLLRVLIMVTLFASAYMAEVIRGGLQAIPKGQYEAADSMGLKYWQSMRLIVLPQALKISIPGIVNTFIGLYKDTTLVVVIGMLDPLGIAKSSLADSRWQGLSNEMYLFIALFFFVCCFGMSRYSLYLENKLHTGHKR
jgi:general L-amino acid transport system permease protein